MSGQLTTHALDTVAGQGAAGLKVTLFRLGDDQALAGSVVLDERGRGVLAEGLERGVYELRFHVAAYHRRQGVALSDPPFLDVVRIRFGVADAGAHYHVPLLFTPYSYSTYRGG
jgi:5-hydroxyisourate hydrolase